MPSVISIGLNPATSRYLATFSSAAMPPVAPDMCPQPTHSTRSPARLHSSASASTARLAAV
ncbi:Uncharacterised protein [Mycobacteroides abscessus subsp. abscessus]|nr:Uncharacterised protein [Mycobacteroides abscessus subsp. abscessus]